MPEAVVVPHLVAELIVGSESSSVTIPPPPRAPCTTTPAAYLPTLLCAPAGPPHKDDSLPRAGRAVDPVVGVVDPERNQLLADALPHRPVVPAPLLGS